MAFTMDPEYYFYEQKRFHTFPKRLKKIAEDLPDSIKFSHLSPKVAAFLVNKEKQKHEEDFIDDGHNSKSFIHELSPAFNTTKSHQDFSLSVDEDSPRYLLEESKRSAESVLLQLSRIIYYYDNIASHIPKSLEYQMMSGYTELTADVQVAYREWQTRTSREAHRRWLAETHSERGQEKITLNLLDSSRSSITQSQGSDTGRSNKRRLLTKTDTGLPEIAEDGQSNADLGRLNIKLGDKHCRQQERLKLNDAKVSGQGTTAGRNSRLKRGLNDFDYIPHMAETASDIKSLTNPSYYMSVIQFQLSSKICEEKGWIHQKGKEEELAKEVILEYCVQRLQQQLKTIKDQRAVEAQMGLNSPLVLRYYGDARRETLLKYRKLPIKATSNNSMKDGKPCIPKMSEDLNEVRQLMLTTYADGTTVAYYPSGRPAVVACAAGFERPGFYTIVYDDDPGMRMLAVFTPCGRGSCYHMNGNVRYLSTIKGGHIANKDGKLIRHWKWPQTQMKLSTLIQFQLNQHLNFRCVAENYSVIIFTCQKETARFFVNATPGASIQKRDDNDQLHTAFNFSSKAAKELLRLCAPKVKSKSKKKKEKMTKQISELVKSMESQENLVYDLESDKHLARLQRKARNLVDDWLEHYRITIGIQSPTLTQLSETPRKTGRGTLSAKTTDRREDRSCLFGLNSKESVSALARTPSAPSKSSLMKHRDSSADLELTTSVIDSSPTIKFCHSMEYTETPVEDKSAENNLPFSLEFTEKLARLSESGNKSKSGSAHTKSAVSHHPTSISLQEKENKVGNLNLCPVSLRKQVLSNTSSQCRCSRDVIPYIMDVEYETYINEMAPVNQLQIIAVVSSNYSQSSFAEVMLNEIYESQNRNRTNPCPQSRSDMFRLLRYDINTAMDGVDGPQPFLLTQHNVVPGMFLIYAGGHLLFCDHIFNGYGNAKRDFKKQVMKSKLDYVRGLSLPRDFRFSPSRGPHGLRSPWGGEIGGADVLFGSSGKEPVPILKDTSNYDSLPDVHTNNIKIASNHIGELINLQETSLAASSRIPELPTINLPSSQKSGHGTSHQLELVSKDNKSNRTKQQNSISKDHGLNRRLGHSTNKHKIISL